MRKASIKIKKQIPVKVRATQESVKLKLGQARHSLGCVVLEFNGKILRQWELNLDGDNLRTVRIA